MKLVSRLAVVVAVTLTLAAFLAGPVAMAKEAKDSVKQISSKTKKIIDHGMVKAVQKALVEAGYKVTVDGKIGRNTRSALKKFQRKNQLKVTGRIDKATKVKMGI
jgi:peptidoglycan hydrolase-like protein with peptidoglycan-binding domain